MSSDKALVGYTLIKVDGGKWVPPCGEESAMSILTAYLAGTVICSLVGIVRMRQRSDLALRQGGWLLATCHLWPLWVVFYVLVMPMASVADRKSKAPQVNPLPLAVG